MKGIGDPSRLLLVTEASRNQDDKSWFLELLYLSMPEKSGDRSLSSLNFPMSRILELNVALLGKNLLHIFT